MSQLDGNEVKVNIQENSHNKSSRDYEKKQSIEMMDYPNHGDGTENDIHAVENFRLPSNLRNTFRAVILLFLLGVLMIGIGTILFCTTFELEKSIPFWTIGGIVFIPGGYYAYQFYKAKKCKDLDQRNEILEDIPEL
jgi:hypothetical protein